MMQGNSGSLDRERHKQRFSKLHRYPCVVQVPIVDQLWWLPSAIMAHQKTITKGTRSASTAHGPAWW
ncbi:hypothetical protein XENTR_v10016702 [Xenopus tropicalis]|nr:hypothetical protein XENTR_v10016702 [Xenopus tropicalis]